MAGQISVTFLLHKLSQLLERQGNDLHGLDDQVRRLYNQFEVTPRFRENNEGTRDGWLLLQEISKLADEAEKVVDTYFRNVASKKHSTDGTGDQELFNLMMLIEENIQKIIESRYRYEYGLIRQVDAVEEVTGRLIDDQKYDSVILTVEHQELVNRLVYDKASELTVLAIMGEGGTGKSTLALKVYNDVKVKDHFPCRGWILVSKEYRLRKLLLSILSDIMAITEDIYEMDEWELKRQVTMELKDRRYLIVIDDLWNIEAWNELKDVFPSSPDNCLGSRIIVTTRFCEVAPYRGRFKLLGPLKEQDSWELFSKKIFGKEKFPQELEPLGRRIVESCRGRPLVIVVVASILRASERTISRWSNIVKQFDRYWYHNEPLHIHILNVCYHEIPQHLKMCFLYLGILPEDFEISVRQLIQLWISEGLVQYSSTESRVEDVAEAYLEELIGRNLIQVTKRRSDGGPKSCRIHDLLRDLCIRSSPWHENFLSVYTGGDDSFPVNPRRLSILGDWPVDMWNSTTNSDTSTSSHVLRSLSCFSQDNQSISKENWESFFKHFPFLRVLNLGEGEVGIIPEAIEELFHMRYLRVKPLKNTSIPQSIFNLWNLETIDLRTTQFHELPEGIWKMQQLRHIYVDGPSGLPQIENEDCLPNLQTLSCVSIDPEDDIYLSKKAPNLRKLGLYGYRCCSEREQEATFNLPHLQSLKFVEECTFEDLDEPIKLPTSITKITVKGANLLPDIIKMFEELPNLQILKLVHAYIDGGELVFGEGSFPKLKLLIFEDSNIATWRLEKGAMPNLHRLVINECRFLTELPAEPLKVNKLKKLELFWASPTLARKLEADLKENKGLKLVIHSTSSA